MSELLRPFRVLVISDGWDETVAGVLADEGELGALLTVLTAGHIPFDLLRLDANSLELESFLQRGAAAYGAVVWLSASGDEGTLNTLRAAVNELHVPLLLLGDRVEHAVLAALAGLRLRGAFDRRPLYVRGGEHFITRGLDLATLPRPVTLPRVRHPVVATRGAEVLLTCDGHPALTVHEVAGCGVAWLGHGVGGRRRALTDHPGWARLCLRALTWLIGYHFGPHDEQAELLVMDGLGNPAACFAPTGEYTIPDFARFERSVVHPLQQHNAKLVCHVLSAFPHAESRTLRRAWDLTFVDGFGNMQDLKSLHEGLQSGQTAGVLDLQSGGYARLLPAASGWWAAAPDEGRSNVAWYREFYDEERGQPVPAPRQAERLRLAVSCHEEDFGLTPLALSVGDAPIGLTAAAHTPALAASAGFALLGDDWVLDARRVLQLHHAPLPVHHFTDRDIALDPDHLKRYLAAVPPGRRFLTKRDWIAAHRTRLSSNRARTGLWVRWDQVGCEPFRTRPSEWALTLSDEQRHKLTHGAYAFLSVNGETVNFNNRTERQVLTLPAGMGAYLEFVKTV
ncbi:MAG: hypothetical protein IT204_08420 [Fimbriimonadaceae bacterium]|nr:hypothetical protein [Fimbriimonadaceae bacterium]